MSNRFVERSYFINAVAILRRLFLACVLSGRDLTCCDDTSLFLYKENSQTTPNLVRR